MPWGRAVRGLPCLLLALACQRAEFVCERCSAAGQTGWRLNEPVVLEFSAPVEPGLVSAEAVRVYAVEHGRPVPGRFEVAGPVVRFWPRHPTRPDGADAGLQPGMEYGIEVPGLPRVGAIRDREGRLLAAGFQARFSTRPPLADPQASELYIDPQPGEPPTLMTTHLLLNPSGLLEFSEPLQPAALAAARFRLQGPWDRTGAPELTARLVANDPHARVELALEEPLPAPAEADQDYWLLLPVESLRDFGGMPLSTAREDAYVAVTFAATGASTHADH